MIKIWNVDYNQNHNHNYIKNTISSSENEIDLKMLSIDHHHEPPYDYFANYRKTALIHRIVRQKAFNSLKAGISIADIVDSIEHDIVKYTGKDGGIAFPVGINVNNCIAHDSKQLNDNRILYDQDIVKLDIGVHMNGYIIDSANTVIIGDPDYDHPYNKLIEASRDATMSCIALCGADQLLIELSELISEIINSYEIEMNNRVLPIVPVHGIGGHLIERYRIHGNKLILCVPDESIQSNQRMESGEIYAIETYASTGSGNPTQNGNNKQITHWMHNHNNRSANTNKKQIKNFHKTELYEWIHKKNGLPFSSTWSYENKIPRLDRSYSMGLDCGELVAYPPLYDMINSHVAQVEHTIGISDKNVEMFSLGKDY